MRYPYLILISIISAVVASLANGYIYFLVGDGFDITKSTNSYSSSVLYLVLTIILFAVLEGVFTFFKDSSLQITGERLERDIKEEYFISLLGKSQTFFARKATGDLLAHATNDVSAINTMFSPGILLILEAILAIITPVVLIGVLNLQLLLIPAIYLIIWGIVVYKYNNRLYDVSCDLNKQYGTVNAIATETITNIELVKGFVKEQQEERRFFKQASLFKNLFVNRGKIEGAFLPNAIYMTCLSLGFLHSIILWRQGIITIGQLVTFLGLFKTFELANSLSAYSFVLIQLGIAGVGRIFDTIRYKTELDENEKGYNSTMKGNITFKNVSFSMNDTDILDDISFTVKAGGTIAIVGKTGSGKTILTQLINRIFDATKGQVLIDGTNLKDWNLEALRNQIAYIEQNVFLFSRSIKDNIIFAKPDATFEEVKQVAKIAQIDDFIESLPHQYDEILGEKGSTLSGGQKQRIAIARALLADVKIVVLDAFASAIDSITEDKIYKAIETVSQGRTIVIITNKINQIKQVDQILVLKQGHLIGKGEHKELISTCEEYQKMFNIRK